MSSNISKENLYLGVKTLLEAEGGHLLLNQQKLFTLFSIAFQYFVYSSTKTPGHYIIRIEDSYLAEKLSKRAKDHHSRMFMKKLLIPRRLKYERSLFHLDYFQPSSWNKTAELPPEKIQGALIVKNTSRILQGDEEVSIPEVPKELYLNTLKDTVPRTITIAFQEEFEGLSPIQFPFIPGKNEQDWVKGVKISDDINFED